MSIAEKITTIAENMPKVYEAGVDKMDKFADVTIEKDDEFAYKTILEVFNYFGIKATDIELLGAIKNSLIATDYDAKVEVLRSDLADTDLLEEYGEKPIYPFYPVSQITADILLVRDNNGIPIRILNVADPICDLDVANKRYVDSVKTKTQTFANGETITVTDNTEYTAREEITNLTIIYPNTDFICSFNFTLASTGDITITLPESKYIGGTPSFANGETWELNIKNGVVVGGKVE